MSQGVALLDEALDLARQEKTALEGGAYENAISLAEKRGEVTNMAWNMYGREDRDSYQSRLAELSSIQAQLSAIASRAHAAVRARLNHSRQERKRFQGYRMAVGQALQ